MRTGRYGLPDWHSGTTFKRYCAFGFRGEILKGKGRFAAHQRKVRMARRMALGMYQAARAYQALNVVGVRIWVDKPRQFGGLRWLEARACMASFVEFLRRCERERAALAARDQALYGWSRRRERHQFGFNAYAATSCRWPLGLRWDDPHVCAGGWVVAGGPLDAPEQMAAGSVVSCMGEHNSRLTLRGEDFAALAGRLDRQGGVW